MATKYAQQSGDWSNDTSVWYDAESGGSVVSHPVEGDNAIINTGVEVSMDNESGVIVVGDDTGDALTIYGTLKYTSSATNDVTLRLKGNLRGKSGGKFLVGLDTSPIVNTNFVIEYDYGNSGKSIYSENGFEWKMYGTRPSIWKTKLNGAVSVGATTIITQDDTGWSVGDTVVFAGDESGDYEKATISAISGTNITLSSGLSYAHDDGAYILVMNRNVEVQPYSGSSRLELFVQNDSATEVFFGNVYFDASYINDKNAGYGAEGCFFDGPFGVFRADYSSVYFGSFKENVYYNKVHIFEGPFNLHSVDYVFFDTCFFIGLYWGGGGRFIRSYDTVSYYFKDCYFENWNVDNYYYRGAIQGSFFLWENCEFVDFMETEEEFFARPSVFINCSFRKTDKIIYGSIPFVLKNCIFINSTDYPFEPKTSISVFQFIENTTFDTTYGNNSGSNTYSDYGHLLISSTNGYYNKRANIEFGDSAYWGISDKGGTGSCLLISSLSSSEYGYLKSRRFFFQTSVDDNAMYLFDLAVSNLSPDYFTSFPVNSGKTITLSFYVKTSISGFDGDLQIAAEGCGIDYSWTSVSLSGGTTWTQVSHTLGTTTDKGFVRLKIRAKDGAGTSGDIYLDDFAITES